MLFRTAFRHRRRRRRRIRPRCRRTLPVYVLVYRVLGRYLRVRYYYRKKYSIIITAARPPQPYVTRARGSLQRNGQHTCVVVRARRETR